MNRLERIKKVIGNDGLMISVVVFLVGFSWSWLFTSRVTELADSALVGYALALTAFLIIVSLSSYVFVKTIFFFNRKFLSKNKVSFWVIPLLFVVWAGAEYLVALLSALIWIGRDGSLDTVVPFASFAPIVSHTPLRFLSRLVGFHGLSSVVVVFIYVFGVKKLRKYAFVTFAIVVIATTCSWAVFRTPNGPAINSLIVAEKLYERTGMVSDSHDLVVFPEYGLDGSGSGRDRISLEKKNNVFYVGSKQVPAKKGHKNILVFGSAQYGDVEQRAKSRLIPGGEYLPYFAQAVLKITRAEHTLGYFETLNAVEKGTSNYLPLNAGNKFYLGSSVCSSIIATEDYRRFTANGATVLTNSASLGIFNSSLFTFQHQGLAKFMATANARPFLQSSNDADAFSIDHDGNMVAKISPINTQEVTVVSNTKRTPYTLLGEWPAYLGLVAVGVMIFRKSRLFERLKKIGKPLT